MNRVLASFTRNEKSLISFVLVLVGLGFGVNQWVRSSTETTHLNIVSGRPAAKSRAGASPQVTEAGRININTADAATLENLPGVGTSLAAAIVRQRETRSAFRSMADLDAVPGVGPSLMGKLADTVDFGTSNSAAAVPAAAMPASVGLAATMPSTAAVQGIAMAPAKAPVASSALIININRATVEELDTLDGIGPALARRIVQDRQLNGPFSTVESITRVKGIAGQILHKNRHRMSVQ